MLHCRLLNCIRKHGFESTCVAIVVVTYIVCVNREEARPWWHCVGKTLRSSRVAKQRELWEFLSSVVSVSACVWGLERGDTKQPFIHVEFLLESLPSEMLFFLPSSQLYSVLLLAHGQEGADKCLLGAVKKPSVGWRHSNYLTPDKHFRTEPPLLVCLFAIKGWGGKRSGCGEKK